MRPLRPLDPPLVMTMKRPMRRKRNIRGKQCFNQNISRVIIIQNKFLSLQHNLLFCTFVLLVLIIEYDESACNKYCRPTFPRGFCVTDYGTLYLLIT